MPKPKRSEAPPGKPFALRSLPLSEAASPAIWMPVEPFPEAVDDLIDAESPPTPMPTAMFPEAVRGLDRGEVALDGNAEDAVPVGGHRLDRRRVASGEDADRRLFPEAVEDWILAESPKMVDAVSSFPEATTVDTLNLSAPGRAATPIRKLRSVPFLIVTPSKPPVSSMP